MNKFETPNILQCSHYFAKTSSKFTRCVKDYEIDLYADGEVDTHIDDVHYKATKGYLIFRKPGQIVKDSGDFNVYILTLDFSGKVNIPPKKYLRHKRSEQQELCHLDVFNHIPDCFCPFHYTELKSLYKKIIDCSYPNIVNIEMQKTLIEEFLFLLLADAYQHNRTTSKKNSHTGHIEKACVYINRNYTKEITLNEIAEHVSLNKNYLIRLFKNDLGTTPNKYLLEIRLFNARLMLIQTTNSVETIAQFCGFNTTSYFIKCFKEKYKKTPLVYREEFNNKRIASSILE